jgi:hypothetical protein
VLGFLFFLFPRELSMEVTSKREFVTHAVIGQHEPIEFGISNNPEFFQVLSKALYSDQHLAVVREVMCNAWDAHIEAGVTDRPIEVKIEGGYLIIRDFGLGIPRERIGQVYGVYGLSTRVKDETVTGGFGLGCKAPFAYTEHFEVTSWNQGTKTIYSLSRSSAQANGRPSIVPIVSVPTEETGLQVKIKIESTEDSLTFRHLAQRVACNGGMNAKVEGETVTPLNLGTEEGSYVITARQLHKQTHGKSISVRYGTVIYPIPIEKTYKGTYEKITEFLNNFNMLSWSGNGKTLVLQAGPGTLSVTPSRETLSMQEKTITAITKLLNGFLPLVQKVIPAKVDEQLKQANEEAIKAEKFDEMLFALDKPMGFVDPISQLDLVSPDAMAKYVIQKHYQGGMSSRDRLDRITKIAESTYRNRGTAQTFKRELTWKVNGEQFTARQRRFTSWFQHHILRKLYRDLEGIQKQGWQKLFVYHRYGKGLIASHKVVFDNEHQWIPLLRKVVVLCYAQKDFFEEAVHFPELKKLGQLDKGTFVFTVQRGKRYAEQAREIFTKHGFTLLDLTAEVSWRLPEEEREPEEREPRLKGWPVLYSLLKDGDFAPNHGLKEGAPRIFTPDFSARFEKDRYANTHNIVGFTHKSTLRILKHLGGIGALCVSTSQESAMLKKGIVPCAKYVILKTLKEMENNPRIVEFLPYDLMPIIKDRKDRHVKMETVPLIETFIHHHKTRALFGVVDNRNAMDRFWVSMWRSILKMHAPERYLGMAPKDCPVKALKAKLDKVSLAPEALGLLDTVDKNPVLRLFDASELKVQLVNTHSEPKAMAVLTEALKG